MKNIWVVIEVMVAIAITGSFGGCHPAPRVPRPFATQPGPLSTASGFRSGAECPAGRVAVWNGLFDKGNWLASWDPHARFDFGRLNTEVVSDDRFGRVLRVHFPAGSSSPAYAREGHPVGGAEFKANLAGTESSTSVFLSYWVRFDARFQWIRGGKLPGLCGGRCPSGGAVVTGEDGWSSRMMWRPGGDGEVYAYILPAHEYGTELGLGTWKFATGSWHRLADELVLNSGNEPNGISRVWYDRDPASEPTFEATGLRFRSDSTGATKVFFSTFFGGHDDSWATPIDTFIDFAEFLVCR